MKRSIITYCMLLMLGTLVAWPQKANAQGSFQTVTGKAFDSAVPKDFYLEGNAIPTEKRNAALVKTSKGARILFALIDTAGYSSQIKQKYIGMLITEGRISVCGKTVDVGSYGFGLDKPPAKSKDDAKFHLYNQAGAEVGGCTAPYDATIKIPKPLQVIVGKDGFAWLVLGRYKVELVSEADTSRISNPNPQVSTPEKGVITVWKVGSPWQGETPDAAVPPDLEQSAEKLGYTLRIETFPAKDFAQTYFSALQKENPPDILAIDNHGIIDGITTPRGNFTALASDHTIPPQLAQVTESLTGLEGGHPWQFLITTSRNYEAARSLAIRSPECNGNSEGPSTPTDLQEIATRIDQAYLGDKPTLKQFEDSERLHTEVSEPRELQILDTKTCGYWGNSRLAFVQTVSSYQSAKALGHVTTLLILRKQQNRWKLLTASTDPVSNMSNNPRGFVSQVSNIAGMLNNGKTPESRPMAATLLAPKDGQFPQPPPGQRFGQFSWRPGKSSKAIAEIVEFAYNGDARLFARFFSGGPPANEQLSAGQLWTTRGEWKWRVWTISDSGDVSLSQPRSFPH